MIAKVSLLLLAAAFAAERAAAEDLEEVTFTAYSKSHCGEDDGDIFDTLSYQIDTKKTTSETATCRLTSLNLNEWPQQDGDYVAFVDTSKIESGCQLIFYNGPPEDSDVTSDVCFQPFEGLHDDDGCAEVNIPHKFGLLYCCGDDCYRGPLPIGSRTSVPEKRSPARDVTDVKRAPILDRASFLKRDDECSFEDAGEIITKYLSPRRISNTVDCSGEGEDCSITASYTASTTISHSTTEGQSSTWNVGATAGWFVFSAGVGTSQGQDWSVTDEESVGSQFSLSYEMKIPAGESGYVTFAQKMYCSGGHFSGDGCADVLLDASSDGGEFCVPAILPKDGGGSEPLGERAIFQN